jgi:cation transport ATPase
MVVAAVGAAAIGYWLDGALLISIFALSGTIEGYASARTERDIKASGRQRAGQSPDRTRVPSMGN